MPSPFPGMDPYIEAFGLWPDFHSKLISEIERQLSAVVPDRYVVRTPLRSYVVLSTFDKNSGGHMEPDVAILARAALPKKRQRKGGLTVMEASKKETFVKMMRAPISIEHHEPFIEIHQVHPERRLVTCMELLSPSNKRFGTKGWQKYQSKRQSFLAGSANFVEMDLLRNGQRMPMDDEWPDSPYYLLVCRMEEAPYCSVTEAHFTRPLPEVSVPLASPDPDIKLALQPLVDAIYTRSKYIQDIDYSRPLKPPLDPRDDAWLKARFKERKKK